VLSPAVVVSVLAAVLVVVVVVIPKFVAARFLPATAALEFGQIRRRPLFEEVVVIIRTLVTAPMERATP
jgi:hypothetical protein